MLISSLNLASLLFLSISCGNITISNESLPVYSENRTISQENFLVSSENDTFHREKPTLFVGGLFSLPKDWGTGTKGYHAMIGAMMATEDINNSSWILSNYDVVLIVYDTKVSYIYDIHNPLNYQDVPLSLCFKCF